MLANLAGVRRRVVALKNANQTYVVDAILDRFERLEEASEPISLDSQLLLYLRSGRRVGGLNGGVHDGRRGLDGGISLSLASTLSLGCNVACWLAVGTR